MSGTGWSACATQVEVGVDEGVAFYYFAYADGNWIGEDRAVEDESVELTVFAAGIHGGRQVTEKLFIEFAAGETAVQALGIHTDSDGPEMGGMKVADELAGVALPDGKESGHADATEIFLAIGAQVFEEDVAESHGAHALIVMKAQGFFHTRFVNGIDALRRNANFV